MIQDTVCSPCFTKSIKTEWNINRFLNITEPVPHRKKARFTMDHKKQQQKNDIEGLQFHLAMLNDLQVTTGVTIKYIAMYCDTVSKAIYCYFLI